jgi:L,D-transpeptidase YcbB
LTSLLAIVAAGFLIIWALQRIPFETDSASPAAVRGRLDIADRIIAEALRKFVQNVSPDRQALLASFYRDRAFAPLWIDHGRASAHAQALIEFLKRADTEGLDPSDYLVAEVAAGATPDALAQFDIALASAALRFADDVAHGRLLPEVLGKNAGYENSQAGEPDVLPKIAGAADPAQILAALAPQHQAYKALKQKLSELRAGASGPMRDLRRKPDSASLIDIVVANMERWRWLPRDLGHAYVMTNIPDYTLQLIDGGQKRFEARIVVGTPAMPTPLMSSTIPSMTINPLWKVPQTMAEREYLPTIAADPSAADKMGLRLVQKKDGTTQLYQAPGSQKNVLGRIRFNIPNQLLIFQHDTPDKVLFELDVRAYSHGCVRVEDATGYAEALLAVSQPDEHYTRTRLRELFGENELKINLTTPIAVHLTYQTAFVDADHNFVVRDDVYGIDSRMLAALKQSRRRVASINRFDNAR